MRVLLAKKERKELFNFLKEKYKVSDLIQLAKKINTPYKTVNHWHYDYNKYIPDHLLEGCPIQLKILDKKPDNWGRIKGGKTMSSKKIAHLKRLWNDPKYEDLRKELGRKAIKNLINGPKKELIEKSNQTKLRKRQQHSQLQKYRIQ